MFANEKKDRQELSLAESATHLLDECRMVLPGIQALLGFQLIAVFNQRFSQTLSPEEQKLHLAAIALVALAVALVMTPAAYHRQTNINEVTQKFVQLSTKLLLWSMPPLALGIGIDFFLISRIISGQPFLSLALAILLSLAFFGLWFLFPRCFK